MTRLLCVHPDVRALEPLRRALLERQRDWELIAAATASDALATLSREPASAVLAAHVPPALDAGALLKAVRERCPESVRVLLAPRGHEGVVAGVQSAAHRTLSADADPAVVIETLRQSFALHALVSAPGMRSLVGQIGDLPGVPRVYAMLTRRLESGDSSIEEIAELLEDDSALAARVLKLANSAYFGRDQAVTRLSAAAARLGTRLLRGLVLTAEVDDRFGGAAPGFDRDQYQRHVTLVARIASSLEPRSPWKDDAFTGGLLHDVGKLVLASRVPGAEQEAIATAAQQQRPLHDVEREHFGVHHGAIGAYLLGLWGLPSALVDAAARHHDFAFDEPLVLDATTAVALANRLAHEVAGTPAAAAGIGLGGDHDPRWEWWLALADQLAHEGLAAA